MEQGEEEARPELHNPCQPHFSPLYIYSLYTRPGGLRARGTLSRWRKPRLLVPGGPKLFCPWQRPFSGRWPSPLLGLQHPVGSLLLKVNVLGVEDTAVGFEMGTEKDFAAGEEHDDLGPSRLLLSF